MPKPPWKDSWVPKTSWEKKYQQPTRWPRVPWDEIWKQVEKAKTPTIVLRETTKNSEIVISFPASSRMVLNRIPEKHKRPGMIIEHAFQEILWQKIEGDDNSVGANLAREGFRAYRQAWRRHMEILNLGDEYDPAVEKWLTQQYREFASRKGEAVGRPQLANAQRQACRQRFVEILSECKAIHEIVTSAVAERAMKEEVWFRVSKYARGRYHSKDILRERNSAFSRMPERSTSRRLIEPNSWTPTQLAKALLSIEFSCTFRTIENYLARKSSPRRRK